MSTQRTLRTRLCHICCFFVALSIGSDALSQAGVGHSPPPGGADGLDLGGLILRLIPKPTVTSPSPASPVISTDSRDDPTVDQLLEGGPIFPLERTPDQFAVIGLLQSGWPLVLDYRAAPGSCTQLKVVVGGQSSTSVVIDPDGRDGRHVQKLVFPADPSVEKPLPARFVIWSQSPATVCTPGAPPGKPSPLEVYGIGAGPRAVGSVAVDELQFRPALTHVQTGRVTYAFVTKYLFNRAVVDFLRYEQGSSPGLIRSVPVMSVSAAPLRADGHQSGIWDGRDAGHRPSIGIHVMQVRAWYTGDNDHSWAGGISDETVNIVQP